MANVVTAQIAQNRYHEIAQLISHLCDKPTFSIFGEKELTRRLRELGRVTVEEDFLDILDALEDPERGVFAIDIPSLDSYSKEHNAIYGVAAALGLFSALETPHFQPPGDLPFSVHKASHSSSSAIARARDDGIVPSKKLGFHNDFYLEEDAVVLPRLVGAYNVFIGYSPLGDFSWVPTSKWKDAREFSSDERLRAPIKIALSPALLSQGTGFYPIGRDHVYVPLISKFPEDAHHFYLNGQVAPFVGNDYFVSSLAQMRASIASNPFRIRIPQRERRLILIRNDHGFHARDVFDQPLLGLDLSRVFLRMMSVAGVDYQLGVDVGADTSRTLIS